jgi:hypothetical protein
MTALTVLRSGGDFTAEWARKLMHALAEHLPGAAFRCLTDMDGVPGAVPLKNDWPGWWAKLEMLRPEHATGRVLAMDLDTLPVGDLSELASYAGEFALIRDMNNGRRLQSGLMAFRAGPGTEAARLYELFRSDAPNWMRKYRGDGEWLAAHARADALQDLFPGQVVSLKRHARRFVPEGARLVLGHGKPRFSDPRAGWAHERWRAA